MSVDGFLGIFFLTSRQVFPPQFWVDGDEIIAMREKSLFRGRHYQ